ncbi:hydantoin utilization protein B [Bordetella ansorpii]|uniref:Hydantoin utilization protein B n=1 Tax=Bordetella ansorpii TaxID=288768 RepID=A0A157RCR3_9BORD|nr:hydantoinase B/oxoprolinase family protein [Bordetella ansorpii]SAI55770.1 hydantoin utilization protein B [Bordetella ansorpii]
MKLNKSELQIFANYCVAAAESMAFTLIRTAHSTFVKETEDFSCAITSADGLTFASPKTLGATWYAGLDYGPLIGTIPAYQPGDIYMSNDPYSGYVATHTPDLVMWKPVFHEGEILCFVAGHIHNTDMGGAVPASLSRSLTEIQQEGIRFPPTRIMQDGVLNELALSWMLANVRAPDQNLGDLKAQIASLMTGERRVLEIVQRFGAEAFKAGIGELLDYAETQARTVARTIPDGEYFFSEFADEDTVGGKPMRIALRLTVQDGLLGFDFSDSDPQLTSSLNVPTGGHPRHALLMVGLYYVLYTLEPNILLNAGMLRIATCTTPKGTVLNPVMPAAVGMRSLTCVIVQAVIFGAFAQALPRKMPACPSSSVCLLNVKTSDSQGKTIMASVGPVGGGAGGSALGDGSDASGANMAFLRNSPVEINEAEIPIRITEYGLVRDSGGAGQYRGGMAIVMELQVFSPNSLVTARNRDRTLFGSWGFQGGHSGSTARFVRNPGRADTEELGNNDLVKLAPGDVIRLEGNGGGGYGNPMLRDPACVESDVRRHCVSPQAARDVYGVVLVDGKLDAEATRRLRGQAKPAEPNELYNGAYGFNGSRLAHERLWTRERYEVLNTYLRGIPIGWRFFVKHQIFDQLALRADAHTPGTAVVEALLDELSRKYPAMVRSAA